MWKTQQKFEETVLVYNEQAPTRASGGVAVISNGTTTGVNMLMLPDNIIHKEPRKEGQYSYERVIAQVSDKEMNKISIIPGKTKIIWNGLTYKVMSIIDYTSKILFQNAELELRRQIEHI